MIVFDTETGEPSGRDGFAGVVWLALVALAILFLLVFGFALLLLGEWVPLLLLLLSP